MVQSTAHHRTSSLTRQADKRSLEIRSSQISARLTRAAADDEEIYKLISYDTYYIGWMTESIYETGKSLRNHCRYCHPFARYKDTV